VSRRRHDVVVVGAGPAGSSVATFLSRRGVSTLVLDRHDFPREKVCGDGLTPQAIYWLDRLGCADEVLATTKACIKDCDLYIDGERLLTGGFPRDTVYPDFAILLDRRRFDHILLRNAQAAGARFEGARTVRAIERDEDGARVVADGGGRRHTYRARLVIGADGVSSAVSRAIGNELKAGVMAASLRTYFEDVRNEGSQIKVYFDRRYFPGYGWLFVDDDGFANVGLGYAFDPGAPTPFRLRDTFNRFLREELAGMVDIDRQCGQVSGGAAAFYRPRAIVGDRVMLVGDAANQADPLNGGGIHKAMEGAFIAAEAAVAALEAGDLSRRALGSYERLWADTLETDWRTAELFLAIAKNPDLREFCLLTLAQIGRLTDEDPRFQEFCSGVFSGTIAQSTILSPLALYHAFPKDPRTWMSVVEAEGGLATGTARLAASWMGSLALAGGRMARDPLRSLDWTLEVAGKAVRLTDRRIARPPTALTPGA
jgi:geranylgeranyl reductase family protein